MEKIADKIGTKKQGPCQGKKRKDRNGTHQACVRVGSEFFNTTRNELEVYICPMFA